MRKKNYGCKIKSEYRRKFSRGIIWEEIVVIGTTKSKKEIQEDLIRTIQEKNISVGRTFNTKKELYSILGLIDEDNSNSTKKIDKIVQSVLKYESTNNTGPRRNEIKIVEIYEEPKKIIDGRVNNGTSIYSDLIEAILITYMIQGGSTHYEYTLPQLYIMTGMCNSKYHSEKERTLIHEKDPLYTKFEVNSFMTNSNNLMRRSLYSALSSMKQRSLIDYTKDKIIIEENNVRRIATKDEVTIILDTQKEVLKNNNCSTIFMACIKMGSSKYYGEVKKLLHERYEWINYYDQLTIITASQFNMVSGLEETLLKIKMKELNFIVQSNLVNKAERDLNKHEVELHDKWEKYLNKQVKYKGVYSTYKDFKKFSGERYLPDNYVEIQKELIKYFISIIPEDQEKIIEMASSIIDNEEQMQFFIESGIL